MNLVETSKGVYVNMDYIDSLYIDNGSYMFSLTGRDDYTPMTKEAFNTVLMYGKIRVQQENNQ